MTVGQAWFGWTEKPGDPAADALKRQRALMVSALRAAEQSLAASDKTAAGNIGGVAGFLQRIRRHRRGRHECHPR